MSVRRYRHNGSGHMHHSQDDGNSVRTRTDHMGDNPRRLGLEMVQAVAKMTDNALGVDTRWFYYYKRKSIGRQCSCAAADQSAPSNKCLICYGVGIVGGYDKYGTRSETIDATFGKLSSVNIVERVDTLPTALVLEEGAKRGVISASVVIAPNAGYIDNFSIVSKGSVEVRVRRLGESAWQKATSVIMQSMLSPGTIEFEIQLDRDHSSLPSPVFLKMYLRYGVLPKQEIMIRGDLPTNTESMALQEYGYDEQFGSVQIVMGSAGKQKTVRLTTFTIDDFVYYLEKGRYWKFTEVKPNFALGFYTSFDITARWVQSSEIYRKFPV